MTDLETRIREALRADEIGWDDLRQPTPRVAPRPQRRWPTVLATAAAVVVVASAAVAIALTRGNRSPGPAAAPAYAGYTWRVTAVTDRLGRVPDVAAVPVRIAYSDTAVSGTVAGASIFGHYRSTSRGYQLSDVGVNGAGAVSSRKPLRIGSDVAHVFMTRSAGAASGLGEPAAVAARVSGHQLVLHANGITLRLTRVGPAHLSPMIDAVGYIWRVEALTDVHGQLTIPHRLHAALAFDRYGLLLARDAVNRLAGQFGLSNDGYVIRTRSISRGAGTAGHDATARRLRAAVDAMVEKRAAVTATVDGDTLTLRRGGTTLTLHRGARMPALGEAVQSSGSGGSGPAPQTSHMAPPVSPPPARISTSSGQVSRARGSAGSHH
jgi:hypothetical protein